MKKIAFILFAIFVYCLIPLIAPTKAQTNLEVLTTSEVNKLIDAKMKEDKPLTNDELNKILLELKDEKIANLEGNLSKIIDTAALFVAVVALVFALIIGIIGWILNNSIIAKLKEITGKEQTINDTKSHIDSKKNEIDGILERIKSYEKELEGAKNSLVQSSSLLEQKSTIIEDLTYYLTIVEDVANSSILINKFFISRTQAIKTVYETRRILKKPQENLEYTLIQLRRKMNLMNEFDDFNGLLKYFEYLYTTLIEHENDLWEKVMNMETVLEEYKSHDEDSMSIYEDIESKYMDWNNTLENIITIKEIWEEYL